VAPFRSIEQVAPLNTGDSVLWEVVEEHLDESEFLFEVFEQELEHATLPLARLASGSEARLLAHIDALVIGGAAVAERLLVPQMEAADPQQTARITASTLALVAAGRIELARPALLHERDPVRAAAVRACVLLADAEVDRWVLTRLSEGGSEPALHALLRFTAARGLQPPNLLAALQSAVPQLASAAASAARHGDARVYLAPVEALLEHGDAAVRDAALVTALALRSPRAWATCERWALDETEPSREAMVLYAALGGPAQHRQLELQLTRSKHRPHALFALGFSGNPALVPVLLECLQSSTPREARLAAQAISTITGLDLEEDELVLASNEVADEDPELLPLDEDLGADLSLAPEDALPLPNAPAIVRFWRDASPALATGQRYLGGVAYTPGALLEYLERAPMRRRHVLATALGISSGAWLDTRAFSGTQRAQLASLRATPPSFAR
jgi:uncharacterized protein (TIGR02270 family)